MENRFRIWIFILIIISLVYLAITNRYEVKTFAEGKFVIKHDKWTGKVFLLAPSRSISELGRYKAGNAEQLLEK